MAGVTSDSVTRLPPSVTATGPTGSGVTPSPPSAPSTAPDIDQFVFNDEAALTGSANVSILTTGFVTDDGLHLYSTRESIAVQDLFWWEMSVPHILSSITFTLEDNTEGQSPRGIWLKEDGTQFYALWRNATNPDGVFQWSLATPYNISNLSKGSRTTLIVQPPSSNNPRGFHLSPDGTKFFWVDTTGNDIFEYTLSTPFVITTGTLTNTFDPSATVVAANDVTLSSDGRKMYVLDVANSDVEQFNLSTAFDLSTAVPSGITPLNLIASGSGVSPRSVHLTDGDSKLYSVFNTSPLVEQYVLPGFPEVDGWVFDAAYQYSAQAVDTCRYVPDGSRVYARTNVNQSTDFIRYNSPDYAVPFVPVNDASPTSGQSFPNDGTEGFDYGSDGTRVYISRSGGNRMREYINNGTPYKFQTGDLVLNFDMPGVNRARDVAARGDGSQLFYIDSENQLVRSITMTTPDDLSTGTVDAATFDPSNENVSMAALDVSPDAVSLYLRGSGNIIYEYEFGTPGDVSTLTYTGRSLDVSSDIPVGSQAATGISVSANNDHMVVMSAHFTNSAENYVLHYTR